ncbi:helix-turn-helix domain-containing protein [Microbacterium sp. P04]|uniref:AraC family transcriptional regulator n=1 Tax=Microbacterium sp. P04 TaxID=3366947 RepID=UPI0037470FA8
MPAFLETVIQLDFGAVPTVRSRGGHWESAHAMSVVGPHTFAGTGLHLAGSIDSFAIFLQPAALRSLFRVPVSAVMETHAEAADVLQAPVAELWDALAETTDFTRRVRIAEAFLIRHASPDADDSPSAAAAELLTRRGGRVGIVELASRLHLSVRQLERDFGRDLGITPKRFARVARFQSALDARVRMPHRSWTDIAAEAGYFDQMHLIHDFRSFGGLAPMLTLERLGDSRPAALAASTAPGQRPTVEAHARLSTVDR